MKILIADDHKSAADELISRLHKILPDAVCDRTYSPSGLLTMTEYTGYDTVFMETVMSGESGIELAKKLLAARPRTNIIFITDHPEFAAEAFSVYPSAFLIKPVTAAALKDALAHLRFRVSDITDEMIRSEYAGNAVIGRKIQQYREERGMSKPELAEAMGVTVQTIYRWENGEREPDIATFMRLLKTLGVDLGRAMKV